MGAKTATKLSQKENWKQYHFKGIPKSSQQIEVSDLGRVRSNSQVSKGAILKGSLTEGYRKISLRLIHPRTASGTAVYLKNKAALAKQKNDLRSALAQLVEMKKKRQTGSDKFAIKVKQLKEKYLQDALEYKKKLRLDEHNRTTFPGALVHRMVAETFCKKPSAKHLFVIHLDHNRLNNRAKNLVWATKEQMEMHQQKSPHVKAAKKAMVGRRAGTYSLNEAKVKVIKRLLGKGKATKEGIAAQFGISSTQVKRIERGENWGDVKI
ncbi:MAG: HNH endonuclease [Chitinophagaceae bacterium]|nr:HNH endonuclease [Chitinophagaceae bacterium]